MSFERTSHPDAPPPRIILRSNSPDGDPVIPECVVDADGKVVTNPEWVDAEYEQVIELCYGPAVFEQLLPKT